MSLISIDLLTNEQYLFFNNIGITGSTTGNTSGYIQLGNNSNLYEVSGLTTQINIINYNIPIIGVSNKPPEQIYLFLPLK